MNQPALTLVHTSPLPQLPRNSRKLFWRLYLDWLVDASTQETDQLERVLSRHAHHVRPLVDAVSDALCTPTDADRMPASLLQLLCAHAWQPIQAHVPQLAQA